MRCIIDTSVLVAALRSSRGASNQLLRLVAANDPRIELCLSVAAVLEYEEVLLRHSPELLLEPQQITQLLDDLCATATCVVITAPRKPVWKDPDDAAFIDLAIESNAEFLVTFNVKNFDEARKAGINVVTPRELLVTIGEVT